LRSARDIRSPTQTRTVDLENITFTRVPAARLAKRATIRAVTACLAAWQGIANPSPAGPWRALPCH